MQSVKGKENILRVIAFRVSGIRIPFWVWVVLLTAVSMGMHLAPLSLPNQTVFDEVHFGKFASAYFTGAYYFDIHPPLGKLLIALGAWLGGYGSYVAQHGVFPFQSIGDAYGAVPYEWFRVMPALAGSFIPLAVFWCMRALRLSRASALFTMFGLVFENALLVHTRFALLDAFLLLFGFLGLAVFLRAREKNYPWAGMAGAGMLFALAASVKWTGLSFWGIAGLVLLIDTLKKGATPYGARWKLIAQAGVCFAMIPLVVVYTLFSIHFALLPHQGPGDAYMSSAFRQGSLSPIQKFIELNQKMGFYNATLKATHSYGSPAWSWPALTRPVYYWYQAVSEGVAARIYLLGNPLFWWLSGLGLVAFLLSLRCLPLVPRFAKWVLGIGYAANFFPFFSVSRVLFVYHYFAAFIFSAMALGAVMDSALARCPLRIRRIVWGGIGVLVVACFCAFAPLTFGIPLPSAWYDFLTWLPGWV